MVCSGEVAVGCCGCSGGCCVCVCGGGTVNGGRGLLEGGMRAEGGEEVREEGSVRGRHLGVLVRRVWTVCERLAPFEQARSRLDLAG